MLFSFLFRIRKFKIAEFSDHYQIYVKLVRFGKYEPIKTAVVHFDPNDVDAQVEALLKIKAMRDEMVLKGKPLFIDG